jgi:hypothetical protein
MRPVVTAVTFLAAARCGVAFDLMTRADAAGASSFFAHRDGVPVLAIASHRPSSAGAIEHAQHSRRRAAPLTSPDVA